MNVSQTSSVDEVRPSYDYVIVGGGVHGTHLALRLLTKTDLTHEDIALLEPGGELLGAFRRQCRQCGMEALRSPFVHHVGVDPFSLRDFARARGRMGELLHSETGGDRPTVDLFFDHADWVIERHDLDSLIEPIAATGVQKERDTLVVQTTNRPLRTDRCVLAVGHGGAYTRPEWATDLPVDAPVTHVWDDEFDPEAVGDEAVGIVGGGITAAQLATSLGRPEREVTVLTRSPLRVNQLEADSHWMHPSGPESLDSYSPGSKERYDAIREARYDGTIPPYLIRRFRQCIDRDPVEVCQTEIDEATWTGGPIVANCTDGTAWCFDRIILATGFEDPYGNPLFRSVADSLALETGYRGMPVLDEESLAWRRSTGDFSRVHVTGVAAESILGPFARNIIGARRAGERLVAMHETHDEANSASRAMGAT
ncbi:hypothetical protein C453_00770 [Haloferax elongans ATCC BAA-1513]|uniref:FAD-dependent urate hydroxylase HpyO/Asp monooxygenase CreE-like FAD/NAD(P)-binding domain-containing protein n=1 Tax=Haloferax elongans ATCC BAA-1513 TaxID=1230453 RepID=M0HWY6_HALEO|nr:FAD/NAD(P)-binding protein [Haloferax elongans]ELZ88996.1 hypothetical protein C453_00770 [Haloferax elongans ATCC BAA-1513]